MYRIVINAFLSAFLMMGWVATASAAAITYTSSYEGDGLPTATAGTTANPQWGISSVDPDDHAIANDGILTVDTSTTGSAYYWQLQSGSQGTPNTAWNGDSANGSTIDFRMRIHSGSDRVFSLIAGNSDAQVQLLFYDTKIRLAGDVYHSYTPADDHSTTDYQTYRLVLADGKASLYAAYSQAPLFDQISVKDANDNRLAFGKISSAYPGGTFDLDFIRWTNDAAEFSAPSVPEPTTLGLLAMGGLLMLRRRK